MNLLQTPSRRYLHMLAERASIRSAFRNELEAAIKRMPPNQQLARVDTGSKNEIRLRSQETGVDVPLDWIRAVLKSLGIDTFSIVKPGQVGAVSSKYLTLVLPNGIKLVPASGKNLGLKFEKTMHQELSKVATGNTHTVSPQTLSLLAALHIPIDQLKRVEYESGKATPRPLSANIPANIGDAIADLVLVLTDGTRIPISLKHENGITFGNFGFTGAFKQTAEHQIETAPHPLDALLSDLGFDKARIQEGLQLFIDKQGVPADWKEIDTSPSANLEHLTAWLRNAFGWGYWYARAQTNGSWHVIDLTTPRNLNKAITRVTRVVNLSYPGKTKQASAAITYWSEAEDKEETVVIQFRNDKGGTVPRIVSWRFAK